MPTARVPADLAGERFDLVVARVAGVGRAEARRWIDEGLATVDGATPAANTRLVAGAEIDHPEPVPATFDPDPDVHVVVVWEDDALAVVDKPAGLVVHAGAGHHGPTLAAGLVARWPSMATVGEPGRWGLVHRLDRDTSGALLGAKTEEARLALGEQLRDRRVARTYLALVEGLMLIPTGTIDAPIDRDPDQPTRRAVVAFGRPARTHYRVLEVFPDDGLTLLEVRLETGRTHQIRVHLTTIGHPIVGDRVYRSPGTPTLGLDRTWLHAAHLGFEHPTTGVGMEVDSPLPSELVATLGALRAG